MQPVAFKFCNYKFIATDQSNSTASEAIDKTLEFYIKKMTADNLIKYFNLIQKYSGDERAKFRVID